MDLWFLEPPCTPQDRGLVYATRGHETEMSIDLKDIASASSSGSVLHCMSFVFIKPLVQY